MLKNFILNQTSLPALSKSLDVYALREKVISTNIANVGTPGFKKMNVSFEEKLKASVINSIQGNVTNEKHIPISGSGLSHIKPRIERDTSGDLDSGTNNVNVEEEMVELVKNQVRYMYATRMASRDFTTVRAVIKGKYDR